MTARVVAALALLVAAAGAADAQDVPPAPSVAPSPPKCVVPMEPAPHQRNITCPGSHGEVCAILTEPVCWSARLVCTYGKQPLEVASGGAWTCGQQPGCCDSCQGDGCNATACIDGCGGVAAPDCPGACQPSCSNQGVLLLVAGGRVECGDGCENGGVQAVVALGGLDCGDSCSNTGILLVVGASTCGDGLVRACAADWCPTTLERTVSLPGTGADGPAAVPIGLQDGEVVPCACEPHGP